MTWRSTGYVCGVMLAMAGTTVLAQPAFAQQYERELAGIKLNSSQATVLRKFGNPNEVIIGELGVRGVATNQPGAGGFGGAGGYSAGGGLPGGGGFPGAAGGFARGGGGAPFAAGGATPGGFPGGGAPFAAGGATPGGFPGGGGGLPGFAAGGPTGAARGLGNAGRGFAGGRAGDDDDGGGATGGFPGAPGGFAAGGGRGGFGGNSVGQFGQTVSNLAPQQEVTWVYYRKANNNQIAYEFLIGPNGQVIQIRVSGYSGGNATTRRSIRLGSTYRDVVRAYGYPEEHYQVGRILVCSYKKRAHVQFQLLNERGTADPTVGGNKVVAITIATVE